MTKKYKLPLDAFKIDFGVSNGISNNSDIL
jgi:hypothetical protein